MFSNNKSIAQGTIEYLVIIAVIVVISLIIVGLFVTLVDSPSQEITASSSKVGAVATGGISIVEAVIDYDGNSLIKISNNSSDAITLTKITIGGADNNFSEQLVGLDSKVFSLSSLNSNCPCVRGQKSVKCEIKIISTTASGNIQTDYKTINVQCVNKSTPSNPDNVVDPIVNVSELGTLAHPWIINTCQELQDINKHLDGNYILGKDIDCSEFANFEPIGVCEGSYGSCAPFSSFSGSLNGDGFTITDLQINQGNNDYVGLFRNTLNAQIFDVGLVNLDINCNNYSGGFVGVAQSTLIEEVFTTGIIRGQNYIGGIVGYNNSGIIRNSYNSTKIIGNGGLGGIASFNSSDSTISNVYNTNDVNGTINFGLGGITANNEGSISYSFNVGKIIINPVGVYSFTSGSGGISGINVFGGNLGNVYWDTYLTGEDYCNSMGNGSCTSTDNDILAYYGTSGLTKLNNSSAWTARTGNYPILQWQVESDPSILDAEADPIVDWPEIIPFTFKIQTTSPDEEFKFQIDGADGMRIDWNLGDGWEDLDDGSAVRSKTYPTAGYYYLKLEGTASRVAFGEGIEEPGFLKDILTPISNSVTGLTSARKMFAENAILDNPFTASNFFDTASIGITDMTNMFTYSNFNQDISNWNTGSVITMETMFGGGNLWNKNPFNQDISSWDVSRVTNFDYTFAGTNFNQNISEWLVSSAISMEGMFQDSSFNQDIHSWDVSNVTSCLYFDNSSSLNPFYRPNFTCDLGE